jgi:hypothetical protein
MDALVHPSGDHPALMRCVRHTESVCMADVERGVLQREWGASRP